MSPRRVPLLLAALALVAAAAVTLATPVEHRHWWPFLLILPPLAFLLARLRR